ncbi:MAG: DUF1345 domain-containing protein [Rhodobacterales bacterium]|nr:DUF1345 domain-containing protein [Rhodobacterales bacterium]
MRGPASRHRRFYSAFAIGGLVVVLAWMQGFGPVLSLLAGMNSFFLLYLLLMARLAASLDAGTLRQHAAQDDEGMTLITLLALVAVVGSLTAIVVVLNTDGASLGTRIAALSCLPLGWTTIHVLAAFHYAHLHYQGSTPGMTFPGKADPGIWDFLYASFTIGMTAQVSDVEVTTTPMRRAVLLHGVASFFYNTGLLALAVNAVVTAGL